MVGSNTQNLKHRAIGGGNDSPNCQRQFILPTTTTGGATFGATGADKARRYVGLTGFGSLFSKQSIALLIVGTLIGYVVLPILLIETSNFDSIVPTTRNLDKKLGSSRGSEKQEEEIDYILSRLIENKKLLSIQSMPTDRSPQIMETQVLSDHRRKKILGK